MLSRPVQARWALLVALTLLASLWSQPAFAQPMNQERPASKAALAGLPEFPVRPAAERWSFTLADVLREVAAQQRPKRRPEVQVAERGLPPRTAASLRFSPYLR